MRVPLMTLLLLTAAPAACQDPAAATRAVFAAESSFAAAMAARDLQTFATFVADEAVFFDGNAPLRGRAAIVEGWRAFFEGADAPFSWAPELVEVLPSGTLALSSGPVYAPDGRRVGTFNSIWRLERDGRWLVVFDKGCGTGGS